LAATAGARPNDCKVSETVSSSFACDRQQTLHWSHTSPLLESIADSSAAGDGASSARYGDGKAVEFDRCAAEATATDLAADWHLPIQQVEA
jgi:hypothetical protein